MKSTGDQGLVAKLAAETAGFSKFSVLVGLQYHMEAVVAYARGLELKSAYETVASLYALASRLAETAALDSDVGRELQTAGLFGSG